MLINLGRLLRLCLWGFLLYNLFRHFPKPLKYFIDVVLFFIVVMNGLQLVLLKATQPIELASTC
jgi:putative membrane protein